MPSGAYDVRRSREVRSERQIPDGETCTTRRVDQGDGTYREEQDCRPRYRSEPVYDDRCRFTVDRWEVVRELKAAGAGTAPEPHWPDLRSARLGSCRGCEREGKRREAYRVRFRTAAGKEFDCEFPQQRWRGVAEGSRWIVKESALVGSAFCSTLKPEG
jgi:hypothetical protein